jgi:hypothetical protein
MKMSGKWGDGERCTKREQERVCFEFLVSCFGLGKGGTAKYAEYAKGIEDDDEDDYENELVLAGNRGLRAWFEGLKYGKYQPVNGLKGRARLCVCI